MSTSPTTPETTTTPRPVLGAFSIVVADMAATVDFYRRCGLRFAEGAEGEPHAEASVGDVRVLFDTHEVLASFQPDWTPPSGGHRIAPAFACATPAAVDAVHDELVAAGHRSSLAPFDAFWGQRYATVMDPDGNPVDFYCALD